MAIEPGSYEEDLERDWDAFAARIAAAWDAFVEHLRDLTRRLTEALAPFLAAAKDAGLIEDDRAVPKGKGVVTLRRQFEPGKRGAHWLR